MRGIHALLRALTSLSLVAVGREFAFPINYSTNKHWELTSSPNSVESYSRNLATRLAALCEVAHLLVQEQRVYHRELINSRRPDPHTYSVRDIVFARHAVRSDATKGRVDSYELKHCSTPSRKEKKHASNLAPYPDELIPFEPVDGPDALYGQLHKPIAAYPFK
jgi:hypothetical protein